MDTFLLNGMDALPSYLILYLLLYQMLSSVIAMVNSIKTTGYFTQDHDRSGYMKSYHCHLPSLERCFVGSFLQKKKGQTFWVGE